MPTPRAALRALLPFALHAMAREVDAALGVALRTTLDVPGLAREALALVEPAAAVSRIAAAVLAGGALWALLAALRSRLGGVGLASALDHESRLLGPLYLRPALSLLALLAVALQPTYPYAFTLPVALTQDWGLLQDLAAAAALLAPRLPRIALPAPGAGAVFFLAFLAYALLTPERVRHWNGHPGNEPKYLRMALALGWGGSLDVAEVSALPERSPPLESLEPQPLLACGGNAAGTLVRESGRMLAALAAGPRAVGADGIRATRLARQTVAGKEGGVFHVLSPGPALLLAPTLRLDRALNLARGTPGRLALSVLAWNAMGAALVAALFLLLRDVTGRPGLAALLSAGLALTPPFLFYFFQFYPEMPGALLLTLALRQLLFARFDGARRLLAFGLLLAALPWLHQKFLPVWGVLTLMAVVRAIEELVTFRALLALLLPQAVSLYLTALWNFAITGSVRPDALFLAWGPAGVTSARVGEGALGLLFDARYGLLPWVPLLLLAGAGAALGSAAARRLAWGLPAVLAYYLTVAAADNWSGAVCNLGRYVMPVVPFLAALLAISLDAAGWRPGVKAVALTLAAWTGLAALLLWQDPRAANDSALLLGKAVFGDGNVYVPNLFFRSPTYLAPGHDARAAAWLLGAVLLALWLRAAARRDAGRHAGRALLGLVAVVLALGFGLERWPTSYGSPRFRDALDLGAGATLFAPGAERDRAGDALLLAPRRVELLVRSREPLSQLTLLLAGEGTLRVAGRPPVALRPAGVRVEVGLEPLRGLVGRRGARETLARGTLRLSSAGPVSLRAAPAEP